MKKRRHRAIPTPPTGWETVSGGKDVPKDTAKALEHLNASAREDNQYAQYTLGKLYLTGEDVAQDREQAYRWFWESASQGNEYAQFFLDHFHDNHSPNVLLSATKLLHHMGRIFQDNSVPPCPPGSHRADRKLLQKIRQRRSPWVTSRMTMRKSRIWMA